MGYPSQGVEGQYRNPIKEVKRYVARRRAPFRCRGGACGFFSPRTTRHIAPAGHRACARASRQTARPRPR